MDYPATFNVLIDAKKINDGGIGTSLRNLIKGLLTVPNINITLLSTKEKLSTYEWKDDINLIEDDTKPYSLKESFLLAKKIDFSQYDLFHTPHYTLPFNVNIPTVATIHDIIHITNPKKFYYPLIAKPCINSTLKRASKIITVSEASKNLLIDNFKYAKRNSNKIVVIPNAVSLKKLDSIEEIREKQYPFDYYISVFSNTMPHKGLNDLLWAYSRLEEKFAKYNLPKLILVGFGIQKLLDSNEIRNYKISKNVKVLGAVSTSKLTNLISHAKAMLIPSLAEGFYIPALDAQSLEVPFVTRPVPAICELLSKNDFCAKSMSKEDFYEEIKTFFQVSREHGFSYISNEKNLKKYKLENVLLRILDVYSEVTDKVIQRPSSGSSGGGEELKEAV